MINIFLNKKKLPAISPIFCWWHQLVSNDLVSLELCGIEFKVKSELFNCHFAAQSTPAKNPSTLANFKYRIDKRLNSCTIHEMKSF